MQLQIVRDILWFVFLTLFLTCCSVPDIFDVGAPRDENEPLPDPSTFLEAEPGPLDPELEELQPARRYAAGQTPPLIFLHRAWRKIAHPSSPASMRSSDQPFDRSAPFRLPPQYRWPELMDQFWSGFSGTFHVLHRPSVQQWADVVEQNGSSGAELWEGISRAKAAIVLMALALGSFYRDRAHRDKKANKPDEWIWSLNFGDNLFSTSIAFTDAEDGYPTLESAQVRLLQDIYLICTSRFLQAWNTFGNTLQTITALGYHRRIGRNRGLGLNVTIRPNYAKLQCERRLFWSVYILDKQLSIMLGKPSNLNDDTIDQELPDAVNDEDCDENGPIRAHPSDCYMEALVSHAKLNKILERIFSEVYTLRDVPEDERLACAYRRGADVEDWHTNLPPLISKQRETTLLPIFRRQATLLRLAYYHAQMLVYRPFLMAPYPHWGERKRAADSAVRDCLEACRLTTTVFFDLARNMQPRMFGTIWYAHQVGYCAASIMYMIPHFRERQRLFGGPHYRGYESTDKQKMELADRVADTLADGTNPYSPGPRCAVILRELKAEAERQMNPNNPPEPIQTDSEITSPSEQLLADALRADWEADLSGHVTWNPQNPTEGAAPGGPKRLWYVLSCMLFVLKLTIPGIRLRSRIGLTWTLR